MLYKVVVSSNRTIQSTDWIYVCVTVKRESCREARPLYCVGNRLRASLCITEGITHTSILAIKIAWEEIAVGGHVCLHVLFLYFVLCPRCFTNLRPKAVWKILPTHGGWWLEEGKYNNQTQNTGARGKVRRQKGGRDEKWTGKWGQNGVSYLLLLRWSLR